MIILHSSAINAIAINAIITALLLVSCAQPKTQRSDEALPRYVVQRSLNAIAIDGILDEESWRKASSTGMFRLTDAPGTPKNATSAKLLWDSTNLYIAFECADENIIGRMTNRDDHLWEEEAVEVFFAPGAPEQHGYTELEISPANTVLDLYVRRVQGVMPVTLPYHTYNIGVRSAVSIRGTLNDSTDRDTAWTVEIALPLHDIQPVNLPPIQDGEVWRMNLYRMERFPVREFIAWSPTGLNKFHVPARFGEVVFSMKPVGQ
jgi:Carbohydrate family 9 binding domain-like